MKSRLLDLFLSNVTVNMVSIIYLLKMNTSWGNEKLPPEISVYQRFALFIVVFLAFEVAERLAQRNNLMRIISPHTFLHEGAHWIAGKLFGLRPIWRPGNYYVSFSTPPTTKVQESLICLAPLSIWWLGLILASLYSSSQNDIVSIANTSIFLLLTYIGNPSAVGHSGAISDWERAREDGDNRLNIALVTIGVVIAIIGYALN